MKKAKFSSMQDYLALFVRWKWWIIVPFVGLTALTVLISTMLPKIYISETVIVVQPRDVPSDLVKDLIAGSTEQRLSAIEERILSRTNLLQVLREFEDSLVEYRELNDERKVVRLRKQIKIEFPVERMGGQNLPVTNIHISCRHRKPELAQKMTARLASLFVEQDSRTRENQITGTTEFFTAELVKVAEQLRQSEDRLKTLKERYRYELPSELDTNLRTLDRLQLQKTGNLEALDRYLTMQLNLERQIAETPRTLPREDLTQGQGTRTIGRSSQVEENLIRKEQEYKELLAKGTEKHPDILRLRSEIEQLKKDKIQEDRAAAEKAAAERAAAERDAAPPLPNPAYQNLVSQLRQMQTEIEIREREKKWIEAEMAKYTLRVQNTPRTEQDIAAVQRTTADLAKQHEELKAKLTQAQLAESLESRRRGSLFAIIDPANYPLEPATPSRSVFILLGSFISLAMGLFIVLLVGILDPRIWTQPELERLLGCAVLVEIPKIVPEADIAWERKRKLLHATVFVVSVGIYIIGLYMIYLQQSALLRIFDPLIDIMMARMIS